MCLCSTNFANQGATFGMTGAKLHIPVVTLSTQNNAKLIQQLKEQFLKEQLIIININQNQNY